MTKTVLAVLFVLLIILQEVAYCQNLDWILDCGYDDYYAEVEKLGDSNISKETINAELRRRLPNQPLGRNFECIYEIIIRYGDDSIKEIFRERMLEYSEQNRIDDNYFLILEKEKTVPQDIIVKLKRLKGRSFSTFASYEKVLQNILTKDEFNFHAQNIVWAGRLDPFNYSADIYHLLLTRKYKFSNEKEFKKQILKLRHAVSYEYFLDLHLMELQVQSQLNIILYLLKNTFNKHATFGYHASFLLEKIYELNPKEYLAFVKSKSNLPIEFTCVLNDDCP